MLGPAVGVTPFGMGRAYSAVAEDWLALHYNPAGLAMVRNVDLQVFDLKLESNHDVLESTKRLKELGKTSQSSLADSISSLAGRHILASAQNVSQITIPYFSLGVLYDIHTDFNLENLSYPVTNMQYTRDLGFLMGGAMGFGSKKDLRLGTTLKWINRSGGSRRIPISQIAGSRAALTSLFQQSGSGIGADLGMQYLLPGSGRTEFITSLVWHDVGKTSFGTAQAKDPPTRIEDNMVAGAAIRFPIGGRKNRRLERRYGPQRAANHFTLAFDYSHLETPWSKEPLVKHCHLGMDLDLSILSLQLGLNQTSLTFGSGFDLGLVRVSLATYAEELGSYAGQKTDRRYLLSIGMGLGVSGR